MTRLRRRFVAALLLAVSALGVAAGLALASRWQLRAARAPLTQGVGWLTISAGGERVLAWSHGSRSSFSEFDPANPLDRRWGPRRLERLERVNVFGLLAGGREALIGVEVDFEKGDLRFERLAVRALDGGAHDRDLETDPGPLLATFSADERFYAARCRDSVVLGDLATGRIVRRVAGASSAYGAPLRLAADGSFVLDAAVHDARVLRRDGGPPIPIAHSVQVGAFDHRGRLVIVGRDHQVMKVLDPATGATILERPWSSPRVSFSGTGLATTDGEVRDIETDRVVATFDAREATALDLAYDGSAVAIGRKDGSVAVHRLERR